MGHNLQAGQRLPTRLREVVAARSDRENYEGSGDFGGFEQYVFRQKAAL